MTHGIHIARVYDKQAKITGAGLLIDRLWPRGIRKEDLDYKDWIKDAAPSTDLRKWFGHDPDKWDEFRKRYRKELEANPDGVEKLLDWCRKGAVTLLYGAHDEEHNNAVFLKDYLAEKLDE